MWRSIFMGIGICLLVFGLECLVLDEAVLASSGNATTTTAMDYLDPLEYMPPSQPQTRVIRPPEWAPWSLLSAGAVVILYSLTLRKAKEE